MRPQANRHLERGREYLILMRPRLLVAMRRGETVSIDFDSARRG